jgi:uncharacterized protein YdcH (DUF465 family)
MSRYLRTETTISKLEAMQAKIDHMADQYGKYDQEMEESILGISASIEMALERLRSEVERKAVLKEMFNI